MNKEFIFNVGNSQEFLKSLLGGLNVPYKSGRVSTLGGNENVSILFSISLDNRGEWESGYIENSRYARFNLERDGTLEHFSGRIEGIKKFRKCKVKDFKGAIDKINKWLETVA